MKNLMQNGIRVLGGAVGSSATRAPASVLTDTPANIRPVRSAITAPDILRNINTRQETTLLIHTMVPVMRQLISAFHPLERSAIKTSGARIAADFVGRSFRETGSKLLYGTEASHDNLTALSLNNRSLGDHLIKQLIAAEELGINIIDDFPAIWKTAIVYRSREAEATSTLSFINQSYVPIERRISLFLMPANPNLTMRSEAELILDTQIAGLQVEQVLNTKLPSLVDGVRRDLKGGRLKVRKQGADEYFRELPFDGDGFKFMEAATDYSKSSKGKSDAGAAIELATRRIPEVCDQIARLTDLLDKKR